MSIETLADGRYLIENTLGHGGMAVVYLAQDRELGRPVALKLLAENLAGDRDFHGDRAIRCQILVASKRKSAAVPGRQAPMLVTAAMVEQMRPGSVVVDLAAETGGNVEGSIALLEAMRQVGVTKLVAASSSSVYGADKGYPWREELACDRPLNPYSASKRALGPL